MKTLAMLIALFGLTVFTTGCDKPADKKAKVEKAEIQADSDAAKAEVDAEAKKEKAEEKLDK